MEKLLTYNVRHLRKCKQLLALFYLPKYNMSHMDKKTTYDKYDAGQTFLYALFMPFLVAIAYMFIVYIIASLAGQTMDNITSNTIYLIFATLLSPLAFLLIFFLVNKTSRVDYKTALNFKAKLNWKYLVVTLVLSLICVFGMSNFVNLFDAVLSLMGFNGSYSLPIPLDNFGYLVLNLILLAVLPAICEELIFRGIIFNGLKQYGDKKAVFLSALLFMLVHSSVEQTIYSFFVGIVLALLYLRTGSIIYPIILHFTNNAIVVVMNYIYTQNGTNLGFELSTFNILFSIALMILTILCIAITFNIILKKRNKDNISKEKQTNSYEQSPNTLLYIGIIAACVIWIFDLISGFVA